MPKLEAESMIGFAVFAGPVAWLVNTQLNYSLAPSMCGRGSFPLLAIFLLLALVSLGGAALCWRRWRRMPFEGSLEDPRQKLPGPMLALIGMLLGILFAAVIVLQGSAALFLSGCEQ